MNAEAIIGAAMARRTAANLTVTQTTFPDDPSRTMPFTRYCKDAAERAGFIARLDRIGAKWVEGTVAL